MTIIEALQKFGYNSLSELDGDTRNRHYFYGYFYGTNGNHFDNPTDDWELGYMDGKGDAESE